ncbi:nicotinate-nucleotide adenylyltransferase [Desulfurivibrio alkaliphilus]|uniref:Probable nicotinate-nucleotide adenylyltransferase n=1 Tax=Desulfurivibrio alkaliphilus (strain DSM 19089 / UNIQEM U267 / AHT2) TaxID=589865 RepID=D6Z2S7_DESAT|nr:nicotinate-nucleotide adenylyltransferase [Desulfurivibrio alkaliphilus]ADH85852.1 nicotinate (nicotinamide) nucleotide adenylyltransferase [Desulfurivibrio alkaliphilus AHT 2]
MTAGLDRIGVLGGTFDPVHNGHLVLAQAARREFALDRVWLIPAAQPPHKLDEPVTPFAHRAAMLELALADQPALAVNRMEEQRPGPSYSVDTLRELRARLGPACALYFIIGSDAFVELASWKNFSDLFRYADFLVAERPDSAPGQLNNLINRLPGGFKYDSEHNRWTHPHGAHLYPLPVNAFLVSSTTIRRKIRAGEDISRLLPPPVAAYIRKHQLYR